jgi:hypothetical protein
MPEPATTVKPLDWYRQLFRRNPEKAVLRYLMEAADEELHFIFQHFGLRECDPDRCVFAIARGDKAMADPNSDDYEPEQAIHNAETCECLGHVDDQLLLSRPLHAFLLAVLFPDDYGNDRPSLVPTRPTLPESLVQDVSHAPNGTAIKGKYRTFRGKPDRDGFIHETLTGPGGFTAQVKLRRWNRDSYSEYTVPGIAAKRARERIRQRRAGTHEPD